MYTTINNELDNYINEKSVMFEIPEAILNNETEPFFTLIKKLLLRPGDHGGHKTSLTEGYTNYFLQKAGDVTYTDFSPNSVYGAKVQAGINTYGYRFWVEIIKTNYTPVGLQNSVKSDGGQKTWQEWAKNPIEEIDGNFYINESTILEGVKTKDILKYRLNSDDIVVLIDSGYTLLTPAEYEALKTE